MQPSGGDLEALEMFDGEAVGGTRAAYMSSRQARQSVVSVCSMLKDATRGAETRLRAVLLTKRETARRSRLLD